MLVAVGGGLRLGGVGRWLDRPTAKAAQDPLRGLAERAAEDDVGDVQGCGGGAEQGGGAGVAAGHQRLGGGGAAGVPGGPVGVVAGEGGGADVAAAPRHLGPADDRAEAAADQQHLARRAGSRSAPAAAPAPGARCGRRPGRAGRWW